MEIVIETGYFLELLPLSKLVTSSLLSVQGFKPRDYRILELRPCFDLTAVFGVSELNPPLKGSLLEMVYSYGHRFRICDFLEVVSHVRSPTKDRLFPCVALWLLELWHCCCGRGVFGCKLYLCCSQGLLCMNQLSFQCVEL